jgi:phage tail sheath gpL-like
MCPILKHLKKDKDTEDLRTRMKAVSNIKHPMILKNGIINALNDTERLKIIKNNDKIDYLLLETNNPKIMTRRR